MSASLAVRPSLLGRIFDWLHALTSPRSTMERRADSMVRPEPQARASSHATAAPRTSLSFAEIEIVKPAVIGESAARSLEVITVAASGAAPSSAARRRVGGRHKVAERPAIALRLSAVARLNAGLVRAPTGVAGIRQGRNKPLPQTAHKAASTVGRARHQANRPRVYCAIRAA